VVTAKQTLFTFVYIKGIFHGFSRKKWNMGEVPPPPICPYFYVGYYVLGKMFQILL
jgi:hypothetical protein